MSELRFHPRSGRLIEPRPKRRKYHCYTHPEERPDVEAIERTQGYIAITKCSKCGRQINKMRRADLEALYDMYARPDADGCDYWETEIYWILEANPTEDPSTWTWERWKAEVDSLFEKAVVNNYKRGWIYYNLKTMDAPQQAIDYLRLLNRRLPPLAA